MPNTNFIDALFSIDGNDGNQTTYKGKYQPHIRWNGWACPYFNQATAQKIINDFYEIHTFENGRFALTDENGDTDTYDHVLIDGEEMYQIGAYYWTWWVTKITD